MGEEQGTCSNLQPKMLGARDEAGKAGDECIMQGTVSCAKEVGLMRGQWEAL